jgi:hypothetical protein
MSEQMSSSTGNGAQSAHDPADTEGVTNGLTEPVALRDLEVDNGRGLVAADLEHGDHVIGSIERSAAIRGRLHRRRGIDCSRGLLGDDSARLEASLVDVVEADVGIRES